MTASAAARQAVPARGIVTGWPRRHPSGLARKPRWRLGGGAYATSHRAQSGDQPDAPLSSSSVKIPETITKSQAEAARIKCVGGNIHSGWCRSVGNAGAGMSHRRAAPIASF